ncbi:MAG: glycosyltransferase family 2 protein [Bacteroides sp.]|nr:glycosyltransferase family 2 protein [Bacteroides sp.]
MECNVTLLQNNMCEGDFIKVSVCVPIYGVERYIEKCVRSLMEQSMKDGIEFIFVNDCTKDRSIGILESTIEEYPERKSQIKILHHNENMGLPSARNTALKCARGVYILHCDGDDWVEPEMCDLMYEKACETGADIVGCGFYENYLNKEITIIDDFDLSPLDGLKRFLTMRNMHFNVWQRLVKKSLYTDNGIFFNPEFNMGEDCYANFMLHLKAQKLSTVKKALYHYRRTNNTSLVRSSGRKGEKDLSRMLDLVESEIEEHNLTEFVMTEFQSFCYLHKFWQTCFYSSEFDFEWYNNYRPLLNREFPKLHLPPQVKKLGYISYLTSPYLLKLMIMVNRKLGGFVGKLKNKQSV